MSIFYENGRLDLWTNLERSQNLYSYEVDNLEPIDTVTIPFQYWTASHRDNLPEYANVFRYGTYPLNKPNRGSPPDLTGRLEIRVPSQDDNESNFKKVKSVLRRVNALFAERKGCHSLLFKTFIPFSTRSLKDSCKSLFPFTGIGREHLASKGLQGHIVGSLVIGVAMLIADLATVAFRLTSFIPRATYQHCLQGKLSIEGIKLSQNVKVDWGKGTVMIYTYNSDMDGHDSFSVSQLRPPTFYLG